MNQYQQALDWLYSQVPNYHQQGNSAYKPGLDNIKKLLKDMNDPQELFPSIHLAGTNGKGSVSHILSAIYQNNGYKVGVFTSPHILDFRERIKINGQMVPQEFVLKFLDEHKASIEKIGATFFEICTAMAFKAFSEAQVDIAIIETGLGGRLDSTNVLKPELSIITNIGMDHVQFLGDTLEKIAGEKAGIIKQNVPVLIGRHQEEVHEVFVTKAKKEDAGLFQAHPHTYESDLLASYQKENISTAVSAVDLLQDTFEVEPSKMAEAISKVGELTNFQGRFQMFQDDPKVIIDAAHNADGIKHLVQEIDMLEVNEVHLIYASANDKDLDEIFQCLPKKYNYYFTSFGGKRSLELKQLEDKGWEHDLDFSLIEDPKAALAMAKTLVTSNDLIVVCGSFYLLEKILE